MPPLWGTHRRPVYREVWSEYVRSALLRRLAEEVPGPDTGARSAEREREREEQRPAVSAPRPVRARPPVVSAVSTVPDTQQRDAVQGTPTPTPVPVAVSGPEHARACADPTPPPPRPTTAPGSCLPYGRARCGRGNRTAPSRPLRWSWTPNWS
ncbi:hypothetical protein SHKM778_78160 [Streptomyces sp. KM77-8]|uniref:Uncharacterized protein n=1 Tax=Streptomyces haneummycinicus TaxID=3074435 RepID=A0AAT9HUY6_9ACTN